MHGLQAQGFEDQHVEGALNDVSVGCVHGPLDYWNSSWLSRCGGQEEEQVTGEQGTGEKQKPSPRRTRREIGNWVICNWQFKKQNQTKSKTPQRPGKGRERLTIVFRRPGKLGNSCWHPLI